MLLAGALIMEPAEPPELAVALTPWLEAHVPRAGRIQSAEPFTGGQSNPTYLITTDERRYVLRCRPCGVLLPSAHAIDREYRVIEALAATAVPVPAVHGFCADTSVIGTAFYLMAYVQGRVHWDPRLPDLDPDMRARHYSEMNRVLAALHAVDVNAAGLGDYGRPAGFFARQVRRFTEQYRNTETGRRDAMEFLIDWLPANLPLEDGQVSLVHGDFRLDNLVFDPAGGVVAILDWELSTLGHPYADLAYQCAQWRLPTSMRGLAGIDRKSAGLPAETDYVEQYLERRGLPPIEGWPFLLALSLFRLAAICQGVFRRGLDGNANSADALDFGPKVDVIAEEAASIVGRGPHHAAA